MVLGKAPAVWHGTESCSGCVQTVHMQVRVDELVEQHNLPRNTLKDMQFKSPEKSQGLGAAWLGTRRVTDKVRDFGGSFLRASIEN